MYIYQIDRYALIFVYMHVRFYEYSLGRARHSFIKPADSQGTLMQIAPLSGNPEQGFCCYIFLGSFPIIF